MSTKGKNQPTQGVGKYFTPAKQHSDTGGKKQDGGSPPGTRGTQGRTDPASPATTPPPPDGGITKEFLEELHAKLQRTLQANLKEAVSAIKQDIQGLQERTTSLETKLEEALQHQNDADEEIIRLGREIHSLRNGLEDQENRDRRQNLRIRGIPETILPGHLREYVTDFFVSICTEIDQRDLEIDRAHRALGPRSDDANRRRDVIVRLHSYTTKDKLIGACRVRDNIMFRGETLQVYNDLSKQTVDRRKDMRPLTLLLRDKGIKYKWGFPFKLVINHKGKYLSIRHPDDMEPLAKTLGLALDPPGSAGNSLWFLNTSNCPLSSLISSSNDCNSILRLDMSNRMSSKEQLSRILFHSKRNSSLWKSVVDGLKILRPRGILFCSTYFSKVITSHICLISLISNFSNLSTRSYILSGTSSISIGESSSEKILSISIFLLALKANNCDIMVYGD
ncbi:hypothetical protein FKM82_008633 [Ascaphus truei]